MAIAFEGIPKEFVSKTEFYDYKVPVTEVLPKLNMHGAVVLMKGNDYYGIVDDRSVARTGRTSVEKQASAGKYATKAPVLDKETSLEKAIYRFSSTGAKALPYSEAGKITGIVKRDSVLKAILSMHMLSGSKAGEVMSTPIIAIESDKPVSEAVSAMRQNRINRLIVTASGKLFGILTYRDILQYASTLRQRGSSKLEGSLPSMQGSVSDITERNVRSVGHNESIDTAIRDMAENSISSVLVTRSGKPAGILTVKDIFAAAAALGNIEATEGIILSGMMESDMRQYEPDVRSDVEKFIDRVDKFTKFKVDKIAVHVRKHKVRNYEIQARVWLERTGALSMASQGYSVEFTLKDVLDKAYNAIKNRKEIVYMSRKTTDSEYDREEKEEE